MPLYGKGNCCAWSGRRADNRLFAISIPTPARKRWRVARDAFPVLMVDCIIKIFNDTWISPTGIQLLDKNNHLSS